MTGPAIRVSDEVWLCLLAFTKPSEMVLPGLYFRMIVVSPLAELTGWPFTEVITSPATRPPLAAGVPGYTLQTSAPDLAGTW